MCMHVVHAVFDACIGTGRCPAYFNVCTCVCTWKHAADMSVQADTLALMNIHRLTARPAP